MAGTLPHWAMQDTWFKDNSEMGTQAKRSMSGKGHLLSYSLNSSIASLNAQRGGRRSAPSTRVQMAPQSTAKTSTRAWSTRP